MKDLTDDLPPRRVELTHFTHIDSITWSPDGAYIAGIFRGPQPKEGKTGIFTVPVDGGEHQILLHVGAIRPHPGGGLRGIPTRYSSGSASRRWLPKRMAGLCWSPDSNHLAFSSDMDEDGAFYVYSLPREGGSPLALGATRSDWPQQVMWRWVTK
jgi:Tol biopolymer transport system component